jgi:Uma2 family endonuclease
MTPSQRLDFQLRVLDALNDPVEAMSEGRAHQRAKSRALEALNLHFRSTGRVIYLAEEMAVLYPGDKPFTPDLLAVLDVVEPEDDERMSWAVADEHKGLDLVIEILHKGSRDKDLVENVERYARLDIPEYFVYDRGRQQIHGFRLGAVGAGRYQRIVPQLGHYRSTVLGLDFAVIDGNLRFLAGEAELPGSAELLRRLEGMMASLEAKADLAAAQAEQARVQERAWALLTVLRVRGIAVPGSEHERILAEKDVERLGRWLEKAVGAGSLAEVLAEPSQE